MTIEPHMEAVDVRFDHHPDGFGVGTSTPRLSWRASPVKSDTGGDSPSPPRNWAQKSYSLQIRMRDGNGDGDGHSHGQRITQSYQGDTDDSVLVPWPSRPLRSRETASVRVSVSGRAGASASASASATTGEEKGQAYRGGEWTHVEVGLLHASDWKAKLITSTNPPPKNQVAHRPMIYRKKFEVKSTKKGAPARLYISALGLYEACINGYRVGDQHMAPGWTSYHHRLQYQTYDVTGLLKPGRNVISVEVAEGWYAGRLLWIGGHRNVYGDKPAFIAQLEIKDEKDELKVTQQVVSDDTWSCHPSPRLSASIYNGEEYDARLELPELAPGNEGLEEEESSGWQPTRPLDSQNWPKLFSPDAPPVRVTQAVRPVGFLRSPSGKTLVDFGQNLVGKVKIRGLQKPRGHVLQIRHAEVLERGELCTRTLRNAKATDVYIFSGNEGADGDWYAHFTFHGFRFVELTGWSLDDKVPPTEDNLTALVIHSDMKRTGYFECSNDDVNRLHSNVLWSMRGNFLSIPTDCPQRDERLGWTGDIQVFSPTASYLYDSAGFLANWLQDLWIDQQANNGVVPVVIPDVLRGFLAQDTDPVAVWDDAAVLVPWVLYNWSGDVEIPRRQWDSMRTHVDKSIPRGPDGLWTPGVFQFGDWLDPNAPSDEADLALTDGTLVADAYLVHVTGIMAKMAVVVGDAPAAEYYGGDYERLKGKFGDKYVTKVGRVVGDNQTSLALAICFSLLEDDKEKLAAAGKRLAQLVSRSANRNRYRVATGFAGTNLILHALSRTENVDLAYKMLLEEKCPSWLFPVKEMGATTVWERWDSMQPDGSVNPGEMTSFNHYALGSVADWLHAVVGGISPTEPGWKRFKVRPRPPLVRPRAEGDVTSCAVRFESPYGLVAVQWVLEEEEEDGERGKAGLGGKVRRMFRMKFEVPPNTKALVVMPDEEEADGEWAGSGRHERTRRLVVPEVNKVCD